MKKILVLFLTLFLVLLLVACDTSPLNEPDTEPDSTQEETEPTDTTQEYLGWEDIVLEPDKQDLPSYEELLRIKDNMTLDEVYEILGNPQRQIIKSIPKSPSSSSAIYAVCYVYEGMEDQSLCVSYAGTTEHMYPRVRYSQIFMESTTLLTAEEALTHLREGMTYGELRIKLGQHYSCDKYDFDESILVWRLADDQVLYVYFRDIGVADLPNVNKWIVSSFKIEENKTATP